MHAPYEDDLPDLDSTGCQMLQSITLTVHTLPMSTSAAFGAAGVRLASAPRLLAANRSTRAVVAPGSTALWKLRPVPSPSHSQGRCESALAIAGGVGVYVRCLAGPPASLTVSF